MTRVLGVVFLVVVLGMLGAGTYSHLVLADADDTIIFLEPDGDQFFIHISDPDKIQEWLVTAKDGSPLYGGGGVGGFCALEVVSSRVEITPEMFPLTGYVIDCDSPPNTFLIGPPPANTGGDVLIDSGIPGKGLADAPGLQKEFNPKSRAGENAGKK